VAATRNKHQMRQLLSASGVSSPRFACYSVDDDPTEVAQQLTFPCVVKPLFLAASRGVIRADDTEQFLAALQRLVALLRRPEVAVRGGALARQLLVEAFIPGREVALEGLLTRGQLKVLALFDKPDPLDGPFFEETLYATPSRLPEVVQAPIAEFCSRGIRRAAGRRSAGRRP
jgi:biotin carboxylase